MPTLRIEADYAAALTMALIPAIGIAAVGGLAGTALAAGLIGAGGALLVLPVLYQLHDIKIWREWSDGTIDSRLLEIDIKDNQTSAKIAVTIPRPNFGTAGEPVITSASTRVENGKTRLRIEGADWTWTPSGGASSRYVGDELKDVRVVFRNGTDEIVVTTASTTANVTFGGTAGASWIELDVPAKVLLGLAEISVERPVNGALAGKAGAPRSDTSYIESQAITIDNVARYGFRGTRTGIEVLDLSSTAEGGGADTFVGQIQLGTRANDVVVTGDLSRAFVATAKGIAVIDAFTLQQFDVNPRTAEVDFIKLPQRAGVTDPTGDYGPAEVTALAVDPNGKTLYAAALGRIYMIDIDPGSPDYLKVKEGKDKNGKIFHVDVTVKSEGVEFGHITSLAVNADGTRLYATAPVSEAFGERMWLRNRDNDKGEVVVINIDDRERPAPKAANTNKWRQIIGRLDGGLEPYEVQATADPNRMVFTSRGDDRMGLKTITVTNNKSNQFAATVKAVKLQLNKGEVGIKEIPLANGDGFYYGALTTRKSTQVNDLDVRNATSVAVTSDLNWAFVADWGLSPYLWFNDAQMAAQVIDLHNTGSKIMIVRDPFGLNGGPQLMASTTPIPESFLYDLEIDSTGTRLYANYSAAGTVAVLDIEKTLAAAQLKDKPWTEQPLDGNFAGVPGLHHPGIDVTFDGQGLALQAVDALELLGPTGQRDIHGDDRQELTFSWRVNTQIYKGPNLGQRLYVSALPPGQGLWPTDAPTPRGDNDEEVDEAKQYPGIPDNNPGAIFHKDFAFKPGKWHVNAMGGVIGTEDPNTDVVEVTFNKGFAEVLTAGQSYYWGVQMIGGSGVRESATFQAGAIDTTDGFNGVTVITHGFQLDMTPGDGRFSQRNADGSIKWFAEMANMIVQASGGGVALWYDKVTGDWWDPLTNKRNQFAVQEGKAIVLVSDWYKESDISDSGFSEAAADAIFASIMRLNKQIGGDRLLGSAMHFIGHSRGTVVNSEILQRLGTFAPNAGGDRGIQMTTLDPHDFEQKSLDVDINKLVQLVMKAVGVVTSIVPPLAAVVNGFAKIVPGLLKAADYLGLELDPAPFSDFKDPDVQVWDNVDFADNYYQVLAKTEKTNGYFTGTPNGRDIKNEVEVVEGQPKQTNQADISLDLKGRAGFEGEDNFLGLLGSLLGGFTPGMGGPHSRVWQWYAGTVDTSISTFDSNPVFRRIVDEGVATLAVGIPTQPFNDKPWYAVSPSYVTSGNVSERKKASSGEVMGGSITEGVGMGWYYSAAGGGLDYRFKTGGRVSVGYDNTEVTKGPDAVPTVFNGDFEYGTRQSIYNLLVGVDRGRFPLSYEMPGWSFHGGKGFELDLGEIIVPGINFTEVDITGLLVIQTSRTQVLRDTFNKLWDVFGEKISAAIVKAINGKVSGLPALPNDKSTPEYKKWWQDNWGKGTDNRLKYDARNYFVKRLDDLMKYVFDDGWNPLAYATGDKPIDGAKMDGFKKMIGEGIKKLFEKILGDTSDYALLMGGENALKAFYQVMFDLEEEALGGEGGEAYQKYRQAREKMLDRVLDAQKITHNRLLIPEDSKYLNFEITVPWIATHTTGIEITITPVDQHIPPYVTKVTFKPGFFDKQLYSVEVPEEYRGLIATLSFEQVSNEAPVGVVVDRRLPTIFEFDGIVEWIVNQHEVETLTETNRHKLDAMARWLLANPDKVIEIDGYADVRAGNDYNMELSQKRINSVVAYLNKYLSDNGDLTARAEVGKAHGEEDATTPELGGTEAGFQRDRRSQAWIRVWDKPHDQPDDLTNGLSQLYFLDAIRFSPTMNGNPLRVEAGLPPQGSSAPFLTQTQLDAAIKEAKARWIEANLVDNTEDLIEDVTFEIKDLEGDQLLRFDEGKLQIDLEAGGYGWFFDETPGQDSEYFGAIDASEIRGRTFASETRIDLLSAVMHGIGRVISLKKNPGNTPVMYETLGTGVRRLLLTDGTAAATHPRTRGATTGLMSVEMDGATALSTGARALLAMEAAAAIQAVGVINGDFDGSAGWTASGGASIYAGSGRLTEDSRYLSSLRQLLTVPGSATRLSFTIRSATLGHTAGAAPDAFEVALLDGVGSTSLLGPIAGFGQTDALLNLQADGTLRYADGVTVTGTVNSTEGMRVVVDLGGLTFANGALLSFDLIGMGALDGLVVIDDVEITTDGNLPPVAVADTAETPQGLAVSIDPLANDSDPDADVLTLTILTEPQHGTLTPPSEAGAGWLYTPDAGYAGVDSFTYQISDGKGGTATSTVSITVQPVNAAPVLAPVESRTVVEGTTVALQLVASDSDHAADTLVYELIEGPTGATVTPTGVLSWTAAGANLAHTFRVRVTDPAGAISEQTFAVAVTALPVNAAPVLSPVESQTVLEGTAVSLQLVASDADHAADTLVYELVEGPAGATVTPSGALSWTAAGASLAHTFRVRVTDPAGATSEQTFAIAVTAQPVNAAPVLAPVESRTVIEGTTVSLQLVASDADHAAETLVYLLVEGPAGATLTTAGALSWTAAGANVVHTFRVGVTDPAGAISEQTFAVVVTPVPVNAAPVLAPIESRTVVEGTLVSLQLQATDADHPAGSLAYAMIDGPAGATVSTTGALSWTAAGANLVHTFRVRVTDPDGATSEQVFAVAVTAVPVNVAPVLAPIASRSMLEGTLLSLQLVASDAEDEAGALVYSLVEGPVGATVTTSGALTWTAAGANLVHSFRVRVTDSAGATSEQTFAVAVSAVSGNVGPVLNPVESQTVVEGTLVVLQLIASDAGHAAETLVYALVEGPAGATVTPGGALSWTAAGANVAHTFRVRVTNPAGASSDQTFAIVVTAVPVNAPPVLAPVESRTVIEGTAVALQLIAADANHAANTLVYSLVEGPAGAVLSASGALSWTAVGANVVHLFRVRVTDPAGASSEQTFAIAVAAAPVNAAPVLAPVESRTVVEGTAVALQLVATDADHATDTLLYELVEGPAGATLSPSGALSWTAAGANRVHAFRVRVTDPAGATGEQTFAIAVTAVPVNAAPVLAPVESRTVVEGTVVALQLVASDADHAADTLLYELIEGPAGATLSQSGALSWTAAGANLVHTFRVRATDPAGVTSEQTFAVAVTAVPVNAAPVLAPIESRTVVEGSAVTLQLVATDADHAPGTLVYALVEGPAGAILTPDGVLRWTAAGANIAHTFRIRVSDPAGATSEQTFAVAVTAVPVNSAPVLAPIDHLIVLEGSSITLQLTATDAEDPVSALRFELRSAPDGAAITPDGKLTWLAADGNLEASFLVRVSDTAGAFAERRFTVSVRDVPPAVSVSGPSGAIVGRSYALQLASSDIGLDPALQWIIDWGDGTALSHHPGDATSATHRYAQAGSFTIRATLLNEDGSFQAQPVAVAARLPEPLLVTGSSIAAGAILVRFSSAIDAASVTPGAVTLIGALSGPVTASLAFGGDGQGLIVTRADGRALQYDHYDLVISDDAIRSRDGVGLDGDADGTAGGDYRTSLLNADPRSGTALLPDFMQAPGETVNAPRGAESGLQVRFTSDGGVKTVVFTVSYDPKLLTVSGVVPGADLPQGARLGLELLTTAGGVAQARITVVSDTPIAAGNRWIASLDARVPGDATYGARSILKVTVETINAAAPTAGGRDEALQLVGRFGDADGDGELTLQDKWWTTRVALGLDRDFAAWPDAPATLVADVQDHRPFADPRLPEPAPDTVEGMPAHESEAAAKAASDPIVYGTQSAVDAWAGAVHATHGKGAKSAAKAAPAQLSPPQGAGQVPGVAPVVAPPGETPSADLPAASSAPVIDMGAMPAAVSGSGPAGASPSADARGWLSQMLGGAGEGKVALEQMFLPILLPALKPQRTERSRRRKRTEEEGLESCE
jgi:large repetitive protein